MFWERFAGRGRGRPEGGAAQPGRTFPGAAPARNTVGRATAASAGFTLLEVLVVLVILGLLAAVVAGPQIFKYLGSAKSEAAKVQVQQITQALDLYRLEVGRYPSQQEGLNALIEQPGGASAWNGPYLKKKEAIVDPWGRPFLYKIPGDHGDYDVFTLGSDNNQGGNGEDKDIGNW